MLRPYLKIWDWDLIFGHAVKAISSQGVRSPWFGQKQTAAWKLCELWIVFDQSFPHENSSNMLDGHE